MEDVYLDKVYEIVDRADEWKYKVVVDEDFTYIDYYERDSQGSGEYRRIADFNQKIRTDAAILIAKAIIDLSKK